jgi:hypothetical protein
MRVETVIGLLFGKMCAVLGVVFRPFWLSPWGPWAFILFAWVSISLGFGWGGRGYPYSIRFGAICASAIVLGLLAIVYTNLYCGLVVLAALVYLGIKTKFFQRRSEELRSAAKDD